MREEWRKKAANDAAVMHGDANAILGAPCSDIFSKRDLVEGATDGFGSNSAQVDALTPFRAVWKAFCRLARRCLTEARASW